MSQKDFAELIQAELDGSLSDEQSAELREAMDQNPEARSQYEQMSKVFEALKGIEILEPPPGLKTRILAEVGSPSRTSLLDHLRNWPEHMQLLRYSYVLAAGLFLGLVIHEVGFKGPRKLDFSEFYGTMSAAKRSPESRIIDQVDFSGASLSGSVVSRRVESVNLIELDLDSEQPIRVAVNYGGRGVEMIGFAQDGGTPVAVKAEGGRVEIGPTREGPLTLFLAVPNEESWADVEILVDEDQIHSGRLKLSGIE